MATAPSRSAHSTSTGEIEELLASWRRHMVAQRMSPATLSTYSTSVGQLARFLAAEGMPTSPMAITPRARRGVHHRPPRALEAGDSSQPLPGGERVLSMAGRRGRDPRVADGPDEAAQAARPTPASPSSRRAATVARGVRRTRALPTSRRGDLADLHGHGSTARRAPRVEARRHRPGSRCPDRRYRSRARTVWSPIPTIRVRLPLPVTGPIQAPLCPEVRRGLALEEGGPPRVGARGACP
jgi:hypothetical protein